MAGKVKYHELSELEKKKYLGDFYTMVSLLKNREEAKNFFKDLLTLSEAVMISRRIQIARMLLEGHTYDEIRKRLKVGFNNINQVEKWLNNGFGGYRKIIEEYQKKYKDNPKTKLTKPFKTGMMKKYPFHYLLWNMINKN
ncbi:MAG: YerC/YecD family TrpR-related protein [Candidatus Moraniibacteriota bacterium]